MRERETYIYIYIYIYIYSLLKIDYTLPGNGYPLADYNGMLMTGGGGHMYWEDSSSSKLKATNHRGCPYLNP